MRRSTVLLGVMVGCSAHAPTPEHVSPVPAGFWEHWGDGQAEISGYALTQPRYGAPRGGEAVLIFVTEDFTRSTRVKSDGGHGDEYPVLKLNDVRTFQTGIYDYRTMTSAFVALDGSHPVGVPTKVAFSMQEWCGLAHDQIRVDGQTFERTLHSYFDGEADRTDRGKIPDHAVFEDTLPIFVRGLAGSLVSPTGSLSVDLMPSRFRDRVEHRNPSWRPATIRRGEVHTLEVPAGVFEVEDWILDAGDRSTTWSVEVEPPRRIVAWSTSDGERAVMTGSLRTPYWQLSGLMDESRRRALGLADHAWPAPQGAGTEGEEADERE